jgi:hypothetical protein
MNDASTNFRVTTDDCVREHVRQMLAKLKNKLSGAKTSLDYTVEVDREKNRSGGVDSV